MHKMIKYVAGIVLALTLFATNADAQAFRRKGPDSLTVAEDTTVVDVAGTGVGAVRVTGTFTGTITFEKTNDGTTWTAVSCLDSAAASQTTATAAGYFDNCNVGAAQRFRARMSSYTSGTAIITISSAAVSAAPSTELSGDIMVSDVGITSIAAGDNNIGNVDVASSALPTGASTSAKQDTIIGHVDGLEALLAGTLTVGSHAVTNAGTFPVQAAQSGTWNVTNVSGTVSLPTGAATAAHQVTAQTSLTAIEASAAIFDNIVFADDADFTDGTTPFALVGCVAESTASTVTDGDVGACSMTLSRVQRVMVTSSDGTAIAAGSVGAGGVDSTTTRTTEATDSQLSSDVAAIKTAVQLIDNAQTGDSVKYHASVGSTEDEHEVKGSAGVLYSIAVTNTAATLAYWRCANQVIGSTTPGTTTIYMGLAIPASTTGAGFTHTFGPNGAAFSTGLTCWVVEGAAANDVAEVGANEVMITYTYK